jgi:hypothetical protein
MKLNRRQLRQIITEELLREADFDVPGTFQDDPGKKSPNERIKDLEDSMEFVMDKVIKLWGLQGQQ